MEDKVLNQIIKVELELIQIKKKLRAIEIMVKSFDPNLAENLLAVNKAIYKAEIALSSITQGSSDSDIPILYDDYLELQKVGSV
jgi:dimeric dUTPase (all-alpha-NTP-PPase superfamily)